MDIFFKSWESVLRVFVTVIFAYPGLIILMRVYGKRSLSKMNMFDFIITVALGSTFASTVIFPTISILDGLVTYAMLLSAQFLITNLSQRLPMFDRLIKSKPTLVYLDGEFLESDMRAMRVSKQEILAEVRQSGISCLDDVYAVVLENNGVMSVLPRKDPIRNSTLQSVSNFDV